MNCAPFQKRSAKIGGFYTYTTPSRILFQILLFKNYIVLIKKNLKTKQGWLLFEGGSIII
jgi:hypothetical protein